jgi:hypothetical protein
MDDRVVTILVLGIALSIFWAYKFIELMLLSEADFPAKYDKHLWTAAFLLAFFVAPFAFLCWKRAYKAVRDTQAEQKSPGGL